MPPRLGVLAVLLVAGVAPRAGAGDGPTSLHTIALVLHLPAGYEGDPRPLVREVAGRQGGLLRIVEAPDDVVPPPSLLATVVDASVVGPDPDLVRRFTLGRVDRDALLASPRSLLLTVAAPRHRLRGVNRALGTLAAMVAAKTGAVVFDPETRQYFSASRWRQMRAEGWNGEAPSVLGHVTIHQYGFQERVRSITLGMANFGLPDLVVAGHARGNAAPVAHLLNLVAQLLLEGASLPEDGVLQVSLDAVRHPEVHEVLGASLEEGATRRSTVRLKPAARDEGDPENRILEVLPVGAADAEREVLQERLLATLFGSRPGDVLLRPPASGALAQASDRARRRLVERVKPLFEKGLAPGEILFVKGPFEHDEGTEWMWVEVTRWESSRIRGLLANDPQSVSGLEAGARVEVEEGKVFDYLLRRADGTVEGNETAALLTADGK